jgi:hypothetical protein
MIAADIALAEYLFVFVIVSRRDDALSVIQRRWRKKTRLQKFFCHYFCGTNKIASAAT